MRVSMLRMVFGLVALLATGNVVSSAQAGELYEPIEIAGDCCSVPANCNACNDCTPGLLGLIKQSDHCFDDFITPMINFVFFEDPRTLTEVRPIFVNHWVPSTIGGGISAGGQVQVYAMQFRIALTDRLSIIATKDGYIVDNTNGTLGSIMSDGWADVSAGLKYTLLRDPCEGRLLSAGFTYEMPVGSSSALQAQGDGEFYMFLTGGQRFWDGDAHYLTSLGYRLPADTSLQTQSIQWSNHFDVRLTDTVYAFTETAWWHWTGDASNGTAYGVAGADLFNLRSTNVAGNNLFTQNVGFRYKPSGNFTTGIAYEFPLSNNKDLFDGRLTIDMILRY